MTIPSPASWLLAGLFLLLPARLAGAEAAAPEVIPADIHALFSEFAKARGQEPVMVGTGPFRALLLGERSSPDIEKLVGVGVEALQRLEQWTGRPGVFTPPAKADDDSQVHWLLLIRDEQLFDAWVDFGRSRKAIRPPDEGKDLAKSLKGFAMPGAMVSTTGRLKAFGPAFAAYAASCVSLDRIAASGGRRRLPAWLREGLTAELQRELTGSIRWTTISYGKSDEKDNGTDNWMADVKLILRENKPGRALRAWEVLDSSTDLIAPWTYRQLWSLCTFLRVTSDQLPKPNRLWGVIKATAAGTGSSEAMKEIYNITPANLDTAWRAWVANGKPPAK